MRTDEDAIADENVGRMKGKIHHDPPLLFAALILPTARAHCGGTAGHARSLSRIRIENTKKNKRIECSIAK
jgi:hypothetical protein